MKADEREDKLYESGKENEISTEEKILFSFLPKIEAESTSNKLLDIGCGVGTISKELQNLGYDVMGIDFSSVAVEKAKEKGINAICRDVDGGGLDFPDNHFDVVWAGDVIEHVFDPISLFEEIRRVLKKDGVLLLTTPNDFNLRSRIKIFLKGVSIQSGIYRSKRQCKHHTYFSWELLEYMLEDTGFVCQNFKSIIIPPKSKTEKVTENKTLGIWLGRIFIVKAIIKE
jgi:2-polyprenyl-3-methyl-5-hydroxy-6-metoxy-1,4-benzoquinol methylase